MAAGEQLRIEDVQQPFSSTNLTVQLLESLGNSQPNLEDTPWPPKTGILHNEDTQMSKPISAPWGTHHRQQEPLHVMLPTSVSGLHHCLQESQTPDSGSSFDDQVHAQLLTTYSSS